jgi:hypothetical protein
MVQEYQGPPEPVKEQCPYCQTSVTYFWAAGNQGVLSDSTYVLVADWVYHGACWDKLIEENLP